MSSSIHHLYGTMTKPFDQRQEENDMADLSPHHAEIRLANVSPVLNSPARGRGMKSIPGDGVRGCWCSRAAEPRGPRTRHPVARPDDDVSQVA